MTTGVDRAGVQGCTRDHIRGGVTRKRVSFVRAEATSEAILSRGHWASVCEGAQLTSLGTEERLERGHTDLQGPQEPVVQLLSHI